MASERRLLLLFSSLLMTAGCAASSPNEPPRVEASYDPATGWLQTLSADLDGNGVPETFGRLAGSTLLRVDIDSNEDGHADRWEQYAPGLHLVSVGPGPSDPSRTHPTGPALLAAAVEAGIDTTIVPTKPPEGVWK